MQDKPQPFVSIIVPCRNEERYIEMCVNSLLQSTYPADRFEVLVVDGGSTDRSAEIALRIAGSDRRVHVLENPKQWFPSAVNVGVAASRGDFVVICGGHAAYPCNYIRRLVAAALQYGADIAGAHLAPRHSTGFGRASGIGWTHPFGTGPARYKAGLPTEPEWVDTVHGGCYRRAVFDAVGRLDERLRRSADFDFNLRAKKHGFRTLLVPDITIEYVPQQTLRAWLRRSFVDGVWLTYPLRFGRRTFSLRHLPPAAFVTCGLLTSVLALRWRPARLALAAGAGLYAGATLTVAADVARRERSAWLFFQLMAVFPGRHLGYGIGSLVGLLGVAVNRHSSETRAA